MSNKPRVWRGTVFVGAHEDEPINFFGESITDLRDSIKKWIIENKPERFGNASPDYEITKRYNYSHATAETPVRILTGRDLYTEIFEGWVGVDGKERNWSVYHKFEDIETTATHFVNQSLIPCKGPDWKEIPVQNGVFPLHKIKITKRIENEIDLNDYLQRGWYILALEYSGYETGDGYLKNRKTIFVIGHPEENADRIFAPTMETRENQTW